MRMKRTLALVLALVLLVSALPMAAMAIEINIINGQYENRTDSLTDYVASTNKQQTIGDKAVSIKPKDDEKTIIGADGSLYDFVGVSHVKFDANMVKALEAAINKGSSSINIPKAPDASDSEAYHKWLSTYLGIYFMSYAPHQHKLSRWYFDNNNHWRECLVCKKIDGFHEPFMFMNWHYDGDGNDKCDVCTAPIIWYDITVEDVKGAKLVEIEGDKDMKARYNDKVVVEMEAEEGYILESIRFYKVRKDGTSEEITRYVETPGEVYRIVMPNFDVKIVPIVYPKG